MVDVSIVIPALNEPYLNTLVLYLPKGSEVLVQREKGLANAVWMGIRRAKNPIIVVLDADGSHPPGAISRMINMLSSRTWLIVGSRYCNGGYSYDSLPRKIVSLAYCFVARVLLGTDIHDVMSGFWVGYRESFTFNPFDGFKFGLQLIKNNRGHVAEYPIVFEKRKVGKSHIKPLQAIRDLFTIVKVSLA